MVPTYDWHICLLVQLYTHATGFLANSNYSNWSLVMAWGGQVVIHYSIDGISLYQVYVEGGESGPNSIFMMLSSLFQSSKTFFITFKFFMKRPWKLRNFRMEDKALKQKFYTDSNKNL